MNDYRFQIAELMVRTLAGMLFVFQGYDKLFKVKIAGVIDAFAADAEKHRIPQPLLKTVAYFTSYVEFAGGILLLMGFCTTFALYALGADLLIASLAFTYMQPMWDMKFVLPRFALVIVLLVMPDNYRLFSLDRLMWLKIY